MINNKSEFYEKLNSTPSYQSIHLNLAEENIIIQNFYHNWITFKDCIFDCNTLEIKNINNPDLIIEFTDCTFNCELNFTNCIIDQLKIRNTKSIKALSIRKGLHENNSFELNVFQFSNASKILYDLESEFYISKAHFKRVFSFDNIVHKKGKFQFIENTLGEQEKDKGTFVFFNSELMNPIFSNNNFNGHTSFQSINFKYDYDYLNKSWAGYDQTIFKKNRFNKVDFTESIFENKCTFFNCDFLSTTWFEKCKDINNTHLSFIACEFKGFVLFNHSTLHIFDIDRCTFDKSVSFTDAEFNSIKLFEVKFGGGAYFDEMKINNVTNGFYLKNKEKVLEWKRTLRAIKQELQKTENKIDFNRFRAYELAAHYEELGWGWKYGFKDKFILWATKWSTDFGNSWRRSLAFTLLSGLLWYSIFFYLDFYLTGNYQYYFNTNYAGIFGNGYFRFLLVTDFYNPLVEDRTYIQNFCSWIPFIFGKIFVAFGIYEMIQSFRKFKA